MVDKKTCWYDHEKAPEEMLKGARGELFPKLEHSDHFPILRDLLDKCDNEEAQTLIDLGCGAGELGRVFGSRFFYVGADLPHIIDKVARIQNPALRFVPFDISNYDDLVDIGIGSYQIVVMNAFIDVLENPLEILRNILGLCRGYVLIHRQTFTDKPTHLRTHDSYGGYSYQSVINRQDFAKVCSNFVQIKDAVVYDGEEPHGSVLLKYSK